VSKQHIEKIYDADLDEDMLLEPNFDEMEDDLDPTAMCAEMDELNEYVPELDVIAIWPHSRTTEEPREYVEAVMASSPRGEIPEELLVVFPRLDDIAAGPAQGSEAADEQDDES
jgi:hypothetical protein